jgi:hypothetical protein
MIGRFTLGAVAIALVAALPSSAAAQQCTNLGSQSPRRAEGLRAVRLFTSAAAEGRAGGLVPALRGAKKVPYRSWDLLGTSVIVGMWKTDGGPTGELARKIKWGTDEPLPGWQMHWVTEPDHYAFTFTDTRDPCGFSYSSDDSGVVIQGLAIDGNARVYPVETH